jgi:parallel beta-helix repeat protein
MTGKLQSGIKNLSRKLFGLLIFFIVAQILIGSLPFSIRPAKAAGTIYYVDNSVTDTHVASATPDCTNYNPTTYTCSGGSGRAFKTIADINVSSFSPGNQILFRRGQTWREGLVVPSSGTSGHPITFGAFGSGANPIINATGLSYGIHLDAKSYLAFQNLTVTGATTTAFHAINHCDYITVDSCDLSHSGRAGISADYADSSYTGWNINNNTISYNGGWGIVISYFDSGTIQNNNIHHNAFDGGISYKSGIHMAGPNSTTQACQNNIIQNNTIHDQTLGRGIWLDTCLTGNIIRHNSVCNNYSTGIFNEVTSGTQIYYNLSYNNVGDAAEASGIYIAGRADFDADNNVVYNNVCYGNGKFGIIIQNGDGNQGHCHNNIIQNNIAIGTVSGPNLRVGGGAEYENNRITYNAFGPQATNFIEWGWGLFKSTYDDWETAYGSSTNSVKTDPQMVDPSNEDFSLKQTSPCIDVGTDVGLTKDFYGNPVPSGVSTDIGVYEFQWVYLPSSPKNLTILQ